MATISRFSAVATVGKLRLTGFVAWLMWLGVHLFYLTGFKNQVTALLHWAVTFIGNDRSERTATEQQIFAREALKRLAGRCRRAGQRPGRLRPSGGPSSRRMRCRGGPAHRLRRARAVGRASSA